MGFLNPHTGNSAEDKMSEAAGCIAVAGLAAVVVVVGSIALLLWALL